MALERLELLITSTGTAAAKGISQVGNAAGEAATKQTLLQKASQGVGTAMHNLSGGLIPVESGFKAAALAGGVLAGVGIAKFALDGVTAFVDLAREVRTFQFASGASAEESSRFVAVLDDMEISTDKGAKAIFKMSREIGQGGEKLKEFGVAVALNKDGTKNMTETLLNVSDAYVKMRDPAEKAALVQAAFGRAGAELIPILEKGRAGLKQFFDEAEDQHQLFTQEDLDQAREYELALDHLGDTVRGLKMEFGKIVLPALTQLADDGATALDSIDNLAGGAGGLGNAIMKLNNFSPLTNAFHLAGAGAELLQGNFGAAAGEFARSIPVVGGIVGLFDDGAGASTKFADAQTTLKEKTAEAANLAADGKKNTAEYRTAMNEAQAASDTLTTAQQALATSLQSAAEKQFAANQAALAGMASNLTLSSAVLGVRDAQDAYVVAQQAATDAAQFGIDKSRDVEKAHLAVQGSILQVISVAQQKAVADLGPNATAAEKAAAATKAQADVTAYLADTTPGATQALKDLGFTVISLPSGKNIVITVDVAQALADTRALIEAYNSLPGPNVPTAGGLFHAPDPGGYHGPPLHFDEAEGGVIPGPKGAPRYGRAHGGEGVFTPAQMAALPAMYGGSSASPISLTINVPSDLAKGDTRRVDAAGMSGGDVRKIAVLVRAV